MCKLLIMTGIKDGPLAKEFMYRMAVPMSRFNRDGIGYTAVNPDGSLFSQRWLYNEMFGSTKDVMVPRVAKNLSQYESRLPSGALKTNYSQKGRINFDNVKTITMHTRFATCGKEFANTHPFIDQDTSLIHNGTIRNAEWLKVNKISTCDSEAALQTYIEEGVARDPEKAKGWLDRLTGSWAFGILSRDSENNRILDVVRGTSSLYFIEIAGLGKVFTTDDSDAKSVAKDMGLELLNDPFMVAMDSMHRYDAVTGLLLSKHDHKKVYTHSWSGGNNRPKHTRNTGNSSTASSNSSNGQPKEMTSRQYDLSCMLNGMGSDKEVAPDIFRDGTNPADLKFCYRKVKTYSNLTSEPFVDRLDILDMVFNRNELSDYESLTDALKEYVMETDKLQGMKAARDVIAELVTARNKAI